VIQTLQAIMDRTGWNQEELAGRLATSQATVSRWLKGADPRGQSHAAIQDLYQRVVTGDIDSMDVAEMSGTSRRSNNRLVTIVGYVGAGSEIFPVDDHEKGAGLDEVEAPFPVRPGTVCAVVRGISMLPMFEDGDLVGYIRRDEDPSALVGKRCLVKLRDGRMLIKRIRRGTHPGVYTLVSSNAEDIEDVEIEWAARYSFALPSDEWHSLQDAK